MQTPSVEQRRFFEQAASTYQQDLQGDTAAQAYLTARGLAPAAAMFRLGVVGRPLVGHERVAGRLAIPYLTPAGVVNMQFRCMKAHDCKAEGCRKYLKIEGLDSNLYNVLDLKKPSPVICVTEGELDAITLSICGLPAVGVSGVNGWKPHFQRCLGDYSTIYAVADGDEAGAGFVSKLAGEARARPVRMPAGEDCNSLYLQGGADALRKLIT